MLDKSGHHLFDAHPIFAEYFVISVPLFNDVIHEELDEWLYVMKHSEIRSDFKSPYMAKISERLNVLKMSDEELSAYHEYRNRSLKERDYLVGAEKKGRAEGFEQGREAERLETVHRMLEVGLPWDQIAALTDLSIEKIQKLAKEKGNP